MKKRKEMTDEQKAALVERLAKARAAKGTPQYKGVHQSVLDLPEEDPHSYKSIKRWIKTNKDLASSLSRDWRFNKTKGALAKSEMHKGRNLPLTQCLCTQGTPPDEEEGLYQFLQTLSDKRCL